MLLLEPAGVAPAVACGAAAAGVAGDALALDMLPELDELPELELLAGDPDIGLPDGADALAGALLGALLAGGVVDALDALAGAGGGGAFFFLPFAAANFDRFGNAIGSFPLLPRAIKAPTPSQGTRVPAA